MVQMFQVYAVAGAVLGVFCLWAGLPVDIFWWYIGFLLATSGAGIIWAISKEPRADG
jgi:hypothetical protein